MAWAFPLAERTSTLVRFHLFLLQNPRAIRTLSSKFHPLVIRFSLTGLSAKTNGGHVAAIAHPLQLVVDQFR